MRSCSTYRQAFPSFCVFVANTVVESAGHRNATSGQWTEAGAHFSKVVLRRGPTTFTNFGKPRASAYLLIPVPLFYLKFQKRDSPLVVQELQ
jgi:hypothetical protein